MFTSLQILNNFSVVLAACLDTDKNMLKNRANKKKFEEMVKRAKRYQYSI
jgi:hypothetical protein